MANIKDIAKEAKVSIATVSRLLDPEKRELVHPDTRERIEKIIQKYRYTPNRAARALSKHSSDTIGMVTQFSADIVKSPYFQGLIAGLIGGMRPLHYDVKWIMIRDEEAKSCGLTELLQKHAVDGMVFLSWRLFPNLVKEIERAEEDIPAVLINDYDRRVRCTIVYCENQGGVTQMVQHFKSKGYKSVGMVRGPEAFSPDARARFIAFKTAAKDLGFSVVDDHFRRASRFDAEAGHETMSEWIRDGKLPRVIFCANDDLAAGAIEALKKKGIKIPDEVAIAGYDDSQHNSNLTTVRQPLETLGHAAIETLGKLITKKVKGPIQLKFEPELVIRETA